MLVAAADFCGMTFDKVNELRFEPIVFKAVLHMA